jgi:hypothetical protein
LPLPINISLIVISFVELNVLKTFEVPLKADIEFIVILSPTKPAVV